jgi:hypothetical protein
MGNIAILTEKTLTCKISYAHCRLFAKLFTDLRLSLEMADICGELQKLGMLNEIVAASYVSERFGTLLHAIQAWLDIFRRF